jgi:succinate dehydrogenase / fumarate reductase cytochrome b subunit
MGRIVELVRSSVGKKVVMAVTGLLLYGFLAVHLAGNLLVYDAGPALNRYAHALATNPLVDVASVGLLVVFVIHIAAAIAVANENRRARPAPYEERRSAGGRSRRSWASMTMIYSGALVAVFVVVHVDHFKFGPAEAEGYVQVAGDETIRDLRRLVIETFQDPVWTAWYVVVMAVLGLHLWHAFASAFQSLGIAHPRYEAAILLVGKVVAVAIAGGFIAIPMAIFLGFVR